MPIHKMKENISKDNKMKPKIKPKVSFVNLQFIILRIVIHSLFLFDIFHIFHFFFFYIYKHRCPESPYIKVGLLVSSKMFQGVDQLYDCLYIFNKIEIRLSRLFSTSFAVLVFLVFTLREVPIQIKEIG